MQRNQKKGDTMSAPKTKRAPRTVTYDAMKIAHADGGDVGTRSKAMRAKIRRLKSSGDNPVATFLASHEAKAPYPEKWPLTVAREIVPSVGKKASK